MSVSTPNPVADEAESPTRPEPVAHRPRPVTKIGPRPRWQLFDPAELWRHRELLVLLARRDVSVRYKQTILGLGWAVAQPVATMLVFAVFLGRMGGLGAGVEGYALFVFAGVLPWTFFANAVTASGNSLLANERLVTKVYFPRLIVPLSALGAPLFDLVVACALLGGMMAWYGVAPGWSVLLLPLVVLQLAAAAAAVGLVLSALIVAQRDFRFLLTFGVQLWMFATPCIYLPSSAIGPTARAWLPLNPAYGPVLNFRAAVLGEPIDAYALAASGAVAVVLTAFGLWYFRRVEKAFADLM